MSILKNAIDSIAIGVEDFNSGDSRRLISSTRNVFAGILLLFKHKLVLLSPDDSDEVLIKQKISPFIDAEGKLQWIGKGKKTVDVTQITDRFKSLGIHLNWKAIEDVNSFRNDIEHYYSSLSKGAIEALLVQSFLIIKDFIDNVLHMEPWELLGQETWESMVNISDIYKQEKQDCIEKIEALDWPTKILLNIVNQCKCVDCGSDLITLNGLSQAVIEKDTFVCRSCGEIYSYDEIVNASLEQHYGYYDYQHGEDPNLVDCPFCWNHSYICEEGQCALCGESAEHTCQRCGGDIDVNELSDGSLCSYCQHVVDKSRDD